MSRLEDLIAELCPDGVEYKSLNDVCSISKGVQFNKKDMKDEGTYPVINGGINPSGYIEQYNCDENTITISQGGASAGYVNFLTTKFWVGAHCYTLKPYKNILNRYLYHFAKANEYKLQECQYGAGIPALAKSTIISLQIPVPPLEVQREIVRILDNFTELTAELTARKQQYEYYRDELIENPHGDVIECKMGDILTFLNGRAYKQEELLSEGKYPVLRVGNFYTNDSWYYSDLELDESKYCDNGDLLYSWAATLGPQIWNGEKCIFHYHIWKILFDEKEVDKEYLYYFLQYDLAKIAKSTTKSTMIHVSMGSMKERQLILPSLEEQKRIASLISKFDTLCCDIKNGLPAEITARQNQYEYYRDKLLTFKEAQ